MNTKEKLIFGAAIAIIIGLLGYLWYVTDKATPYLDTNHYHAPTKLELPPHFHLEFMHKHSEFDHNHGAM